MSSSGLCPECRSALVPSLGGICPRCLAESLHKDLPEPPLPPEAATGEPFGKFRKVQMLGSGGMGEVWKAWDSMLGRWVALKFLKSGEFDVARFLREGRTAAGLSHPNIAAIYECDVIDGRHYIAMQFIDGPTLTQYPRSKRKVVVRMMRDVARAVGWAHAKGVVHRDLKPGNLMVEQDPSVPHVYVTDFGLARPLESGHTVSLSGAVVGTPVYMSPEQARAEPADARSDVYGIGATLYELLVGQPPFSGRNLPELLEKTQKEEPRPPTRMDPTVDRDLETIVLKCLEKDPARRYPSADALAEDLDHFLNGESIAAKRAGVFYRAGKFVRRHRVPVGLGGVLLVMAVYGLFSTLWPASVFVESTPEGAAVRLNGRATGRRTPCRLTLWPPGNHVLDLEREGYERTTLEVTAGAARGIRRSMDLVRATGFLTVLASPECDVRVESSGIARPLGSTPLRRIELPRGSHRIVLRRDGYVDAQELVDIRSDGETRVDRVLVPEEGEIDLTANEAGVTLTLESLANPRQSARFQPLPSFGQRLPTGRYRVTAEKQNYVGQVRELTVSKGERAKAQFTVSSMLLWSRPIKARTLRGSSFTLGKLALADFDGDGILDVLAIHPDGVVALSGRDGSTLWEHAGEVGFNAPVSLADIDGDGVLDIILAGNFHLEALSGRTGLPIWTYQLGSYGLTAPLVVDLDGDGIPDCIVGWSNGLLHAVSGRDGTLLWKTEGSLSENNPLEGILVSAPPDGAPSILYRKSGSLCRVRADDGKSLKEWKVEGAPYITGVVDYTDLDGDGIRDIVTFGDALTAYSGTDGRVLWRTPFPRGLSVSKEHVDLDGDGTPDYLISGWSYVQAVSGKTGRLLWDLPHKGGDFVAVGLVPPPAEGRPRQVVVGTVGEVRLLSAKDGAVVWKTALSDERLMALTVGDPRTPGSPACIMTTSRGRVSALSQADGSSLWTFQASSSAIGGVQPVMGDVNGHGALDCVVWTEDGIYALSGNRAPVLWETTLNDAISGPVRSGDVDGDGIPDCVVATEGPSPARALSGIDGSTLWAVESKRKWQSPHLVGPVRLQGDSKCDWILSEDRSPLVAVSGKDGTVLWTLEDSEIVCPPVVADVNGDRFDDVLVVRNLKDEKSLIAVSGRDGKRLWESSFKGSVVAPLQLADVNGDGVPDCFVRTNSDGCYAFSGKDGSLLWRLEKRVTGDMHQTPLLVDVDGDGTPDLITDKQLSAYSGRDRSLLWTSDKKSPASGGAATLGDVNGDGVVHILNAIGLRNSPNAVISVRDIPNPVRNANLAVYPPLLLTVRSGKDGSELYSFRLPESPLTLDRPMTCDIFGVHEHSVPMYRGWRVVVIPPATRAHGAVVGVGSHAALFDPKNGRLMDGVRGTHPTTVAAGRILPAPACEVFVGSGKTIRSVRMDDTPPVEFLDPATEGLYPAGLPEVLATLRRELRGFPDGRRVPALCEKLLEPRTSKGVRSFLLCTRAKYEYLSGSPQSAALTLDRWQREGGDSYFLYALRFLCSHSPTDLANALSRSPVETCGLVLRREPDGRPPKSLVVATLTVAHLESPNGALARAAACFLTGLDELGFEYVRKASRVSDDAKRLAALFPNAGAFKGQEGDTPRAVQELMADLSSPPPYTVEHCELAESALLEVCIYLDLGERMQAAEKLEATLGQPRIPDAWRSALEELFIRCRGD